MTTPEEFLTRSEEIEKELSKDGITPDRRIELRLEHYRLIDEASGLSKNDYRFRRCVGIMARKHGFSPFG